MKQVNDLGLELYLASEGYQDRRQCMESRIVLEFIRKHGLDNLLEILSPDDFARERSLLNDLKVNQKEEARLPYLLCFNGCETSSHLGYFGAEEVLEILKGYLRTLISFKNQQY